MSTASNRHNDLCKGKSAATLTNPSNHINCQRDRLRDERKPKSRESVVRTKHEMAYRTRVPGLRSSHSSSRSGKPFTWRRGTGTPYIRIERFAGCETPKQF